MGRKRAEKTTQWRVGYFFWKSKNDVGGKIKSKRPRPRTTESYSLEVRLGLKQETGNTCPSGLEDHHAPETAMCSSLPPLWMGVPTMATYACPIVACEACGPDNFSLYSIRLLTEGNYPRNHTQRIVPKERHPLLDLI